MKQFIKAETSKLLYLFIALVGITGIQSCKKDDPNSSRYGGNTNVKLVNASTDAGAVKLFSDGEARIKDAVNLGAASGFSGAFAGQQEITVQSTVGVTLARTNISLNALANYTFFLAGTTGNYTIIPLVDDVSLPASTKAKVRFVQASSSLTAANLLSGSTALFSAQAYKSTTDYVEVTPGAYTFAVTNAGSTTVLANSAAVTTLQAGKNYTVYTSGLTGVTGATALTVNVTLNN